MEIAVRKTEYKEVEKFRELYRHEANCQIIHDSSMSRGFTDPFLIRVDGRIAGYGAVFIKHYEGRLMEFHTFPEYRVYALPMFRRLLEESRATEIEAQTNMPLSQAMLMECATNLRIESVLFHDALTTNLDVLGCTFREREEGDKLANQGEPDGDWVIESNGQIVANGGYLCHYNPPYGDIYMETHEEFRRQGYASYLVQELKRVCYEAGKKPSARCSPNNEASRKTLLRAGFRIVGHLLVGDVRR